MPIKFDPIAQLANPLIAAIYAFIAITTVGYLAYRVPANWPRAKENVYLRVIAFTAEILVAVGIIGLITFAGRAKLESTGLERAEVTRATERGLSEQFNRLALSYCIESAKWQSPTNMGAAVIDSCALWRVHSGLYREDLDWRRAQEEFESIAARPNLDQRLTKLLYSTSDAIGKMRDAREQEALVPLERKIVTHGISWVFVLFCSVIAGVGVALKCAKAALELRQQLLPKNSPST